MWDFLEFRQSHLKWDIDKLITFWKVDSKIRQSTGDTVYFLTPLFHFFLQIWVFMIPPRFCRQFGRVQNFGRWCIVSASVHCSESLMNLLNVLNILNIIKILSLLNLLKVPSILDVLNILRSKREYDKRIKLEKGPKLSKTTHESKPCQEQKMCLDPYTCEEKKLPTMFNFEQILAGNSALQPPIVLDLTKNVGLPHQLVVSQKVRSSKVQRPVKVTKLTKTRNLRKFTKVSKVISMPKSVNQPKSWNWESSQSSPNRLNSQTANSKKNKIRGSSNIYQDVEVNIIVVILLHLLIFF